jgi:hypothetical protein
MSKHKKVKSILKYFDSFGEAPLLNINGQTHIKSAVGGFLSLASILFFLGILVYNFTNFLISNEPSAIVSRQYRNISEIENLPGNFFNFTFFVMRMDSTIHPLEIELKQSPITQITLDLNQNQSMTYVPLGQVVNCDKVQNSRFKSYVEIKKLFERLGEENIKCNNFNPKFNISLGGSVLKSTQMKLIGGDIQFDLYQIFGENCKNKTVLSAYSIKNSLRLGFFVENAYTNLTETYGSTNFIDISNYDVDLSSDYSLDITVTKNIMYTDINPIYSFFPPQIDTYYIINKTYTKKNRPEGETNFSFTLNISLDDYQNSISRSYTKIDSVLANVLSITQIVTICCQYLNSIFSFGNIEYKIMKETYDFPDNNLSEESRNNIQLVPIKLNIEKDRDKEKVKVESGLSFDSEQNNVIPQNEYISLFRKHTTGRKLHKNYLLFCYEKFDYCFSRKNINSVLLAKGLNMIQCDMNLAIILKKLIEYEKLKSVLLSDIQSKGLLFIRNRTMEEKTDVEAMVRDIESNYKLKNESINNYSIVYQSIMKSHEIVDNRIHNKIKLN